MNGEPRPRGISRRALLGGAAATALVGFVASSPDGTPGRKQDVASGAPAARPADSPLASVVDNLSNLGPATRKAEAAGNYRLVLPLGIKGGDITGATPTPTPEATPVLTTLEKFVNNSLLAEVPTAIGEWNGQKVTFEFRKSAKSKHNLSMHPDYKQPAANFTAQDFNDKSTDSGTIGKKRLTVMMFDSKTENPDPELALYARNINGRITGHYGIKQVGDTVVVGYAPPQDGIPYDEVLDPSTGLTFKDAIKNQIGISLGYAVVLGRDDINNQPITDQQLRTLGAQWPTFRKLAIIGPQG